MIGVLIATHGDLGKGLLETSGMLYGKAEKVEVLGLSIGESIIDFRRNFEDAIIRLNPAEGLLVLVDIVGGSPYNTAFAFLSRYNFQLISGINMPMLLEILSLKDTSVDAKQLAVKCMNSGRDNIKLLNVDIIRKMQCK
ncbi:PTS sugar transporter subunit IIA [Pectinatus frisingensis]|uniref:PTS sugar transporter subunit IIA n=1 Tax=Pectinatus frisingensis TaxID=865 RepID=UPI0018C6E0CA|nr:PTS sugar transporter subunit IIA [Pectinatus frisingensis]